MPLHTEETNWFTPESDPVYIEITEAVRIPTPDGKQFAETVRVKVPAWRDSQDGEVYLDSDATPILEKVVARHMGLLTTNQIKALRQRLGLTQKEICTLLQIGMKTWTRWETGRERPFRSTNVLLCALNDGKIDVPYLRTLAQLREKQSINSANSQPESSDQSL
jgi:DNA-binding transcriptional regulator YiaG